MTAPGDGRWETGVNRGPDDPSGPDHTADQFEAIVAGWRREGMVPTWPGDERPPAEPPRTPPMPVPPVAPVPPVTPARASRATEPDTGWDHFVPPEPPPLPRIGPPAIVGITLLALGLTLVVAPTLLGISDVYGLPLGLLALASGLGWLVLRLWPAPPDDHGGDDHGAQL
jgi:hypothetical protein